MPMGNMEVKESMIKLEHNRKYTVSSWLSILFCVESEKETEFKPALYVNFMNKSISERRGGVT